MQEGPPAVEEAAQRRVAAERKHTILKLPLWVTRAGSSADTLGGES